MTGESWTSEQQMAISTRKKNLLVSAAAGTGKTAVLVERVIRLISKHGTDIDHLLVVTFTNAAAAEMRNRVGEAITRKLSKDPHNSHLWRQLTLLNRAFITTLHSFCLEIVRRYFYLLDLDPAFRIADENEALSLRLDVLEELLEQHYDHLTTLVDCYGGNRGDEALQELVLRLHDFTRSRPWPEHWLASTLATFSATSTADFDNLPWVKEIKNFLVLELDRAAELLKRAIDVAAWPGGPKSYLDTLQDDLQTITRLLQAGKDSWEATHHAFIQASFGKLKACSKDVDTNLQQQAKLLRDEAKGKINMLASFFSRSPAEYLVELNSLAPLMSRLVQLVLDFSQAYQKAKRSRGLVDFSDLEHYALKILLAPSAGPEEFIPSDVALELREQFEEVLVDEYQDINPVQDTILQLVARSEEPNLFMVGDVKQSIYRFRQADPGLFLAKYYHYKNNTTSKPEEGAGGRKINLTRNFRSKKGVVDAVNFVFQQIMTPGVGEITYDREARLVYGADFPEPDETSPVELHLLEYGGEDKSEGEQLFSSMMAENGPANDENIAMEDLNAVQQEACLVAKIIKGIVEGEGGTNLSLYDSQLKKHRPVTYRDIVVLLRSTKDTAGIFLEEFSQGGIPAYAEPGTGYFQTPEARTILSLLRVIDNPRQDIPLAGVLRSPLVGLKAEELARIRLCCLEGSFYEAVLAAAGANLDDLSHKLASFLERLACWRTMARQGPLHELIWNIYRETGYYDYAGGMPGGAQRQANLRALYDRARQFEKTAFRGLFRFLRFIERLQERGTDLDTARALGENENVVRIISIHKSKGLEFPVVIVAGLGRRFNFQDLTRPVLFHKDLGLGPQLVDPVNRLTYPTLPQLAVKNRLKMEMLAEEMRILYVALTRAKEKLILVGSKRNLEKVKWQPRSEGGGLTLPDSLLAAARSPLDWLCPALMRHRDGEPLRLVVPGANSQSPVTLDDPSCWKITLWRKEKLNREKQRFSGEDVQLLEKVKNLEPLNIGQEMRGMINSRLSWIYPGTRLAGKAAKLTATEIKRHFDSLLYEEAAPLLPTAPVYERPRFLQEAKGLSGLEKGRVMHLVMQHLDFQKRLDEAGIREQIAAMQLQELLTKEQVAEVSVKNIARFFKRPLGKRVLAAKEVKRELPFTLSLPASEVYPELLKSPESPGKFEWLPGGEIVLVQGIIDCLVDEGDGLLLIDFKSDYVRLEDRQRLQELTARYRGQLNLYARAIQTILNRPVKEQYLYFFSAGEVKI